ncbi:MAG: hypothetical protein NT084_12005 [Bacteroidetes bacterium]|jgi:hypothetical protein|nr:hypothetical protein [Bacteroidota bacterium]
MIRFLACLIIVASFFQACGSGNGGATSDSTQSKKSAVDSIPHEVRKGRVATYAYMPDTCIKKIILGNSESFRLFYRDNGANINQIENGRMAISYYNAVKTEEIQLLLTEDEKQKDLVFSMIVQKYGDAGSPLLAKKPLITADNNFISGNGIYISMSKEYVMSVYADQGLMQWQKGDTMFLQYKPMEKDKSFFKHYSWQSYKATYKFVENKLVRMEMDIDPKEFEK